MINLYDYQNNIICALRTELKSHNKILVYAPTGAGWLAKLLYQNTLSSV
jgi:superfamily II DNA or RNA helicase